MTIKVGDIVKGMPGIPYSVTNEHMTRGVVAAAHNGEIRVTVLDHSRGKVGSYWVDPRCFEVIGHVKPFDRDEALERLHGGCKTALLEYDLTGANLTGADLTGANLTGADLTGANLTGANLTGANLTGAYLTGANLTGAYLTGANLTGADLTGAYLTGADLTHADLDYSCWPLWCGGLKAKVDARLAHQLAYHLCSLHCEDEGYIAMRNSILDFANKFHRVGDCGTLEPRKSGGERE